MTFRSETTRAQVRIYFGVAEPGIVRALGQESILSVGPIDSNDPRAVLVSCRTSKQLGEPCGVFEFQLKIDRPLNALQCLNDDDWVDISFMRFGEEFHTMRGLIDTIMEDVSAGNGPTTRTYTISGREFSKIFVDTPIWFNRFGGNEVEGAASLKIFDYLQSVKGTPRDMIWASTVGWLRETIGPRDGVSPSLSTPFPSVTERLWRLPNALPIRPTVTAQGPTTDRAFVDNVYIYDKDFDPLETPQRIAAIDPGSWQPYDQFVWALALEWADPDISELYTDLMPRPDLNFTPAHRNESFASYYTGGAVLPGDQDMNIIFRNRPFPWQSDHALSLTQHFAALLPPEILPADLLPPRDPTGVSDSFWFSPKMQQFEVEHSEIVALQVARSGALRKNAFFASATMRQEAGDAFLDFQQPRLNADSIRTHGFRRADVQSRYLSAPMNLYFSSLQYRKRYADFHMLDHLLANGSIMLNHARPDIRIGSKLVIPPDGLDKERQFYVEAVDHSWAYNSGVRTTLGVSRGFLGRDDELIALFLEMRPLYQDLTNNATLDAIKKVFGGLL